MATVSFEKPMVFTNNEMKTICKVVSLQEKQEFTYEKQDTKGKIERGRELLAQLFSN